MDEGLVYQEFVCKALKVERSQDLAGLAEADVFCYGLLPKIKIGTGYAMVAFNHEIINKQVNGTKLAEISDDYLQKVIEAKTKHEICEIIMEYQKEIDKYV